MKNPVGGLPRRAAIVRKLKEKQPNIIAVEFGDFISGSGKLDRIRARTYLKSLEYMKYDAIALDSSSLEAGVDFLGEIIENSPMDFLSLNAVYATSGKLVAKPFVIRNISGLKVALAGLTGTELPAGSMEQSAAPGHSGFGGRNQTRKQPGTGIRIIDALEALERHLPRLREEADVIVVLSSLSREKNEDIMRRFPGLDIMIVNDSEAPPRAPDSPVLVFKNISVRGKELGKISLTIDDEGAIIRPRVTWYRLTKTYSEDEAVLNLLEKFYQNVAEDEELWQNMKAVLGSYALESDGTNRYEGSAQCGSCHEQIYHDWKKTAHAKAFTTLFSKNRHFHPDCIVCHTTGAGSASGYGMGHDFDHLEGVQCEVCHGPGSEHISTEGVFDLRREIPQQLCAQCHTPEISPAFTGDFQQLLRKINHSEVPKDVRVNAPVKKSAKEEDN